MRQLVISLIPFVVSFLLEFFSPLFSSHAEKVIRSDAERHNDDQIEHFVKYANHAFARLQMTYAYILTSASGLVALYFNRGYFFLFLFLLIIQIGAGMFIYINDPYVREVESFLFFPQSREAVAGMLINISYIIFIVVIDFGLFPTIRLCY